MVSMHMRLRLITLLLAFCSVCSYAQRRAYSDTLTIKDLTGNQLPVTTTQKTLRKTFAAPLTLTFAGLYAMSDNDILSRYEIREERNEAMPNFRTHVDDYLQYAPIAMVYGLNAFGVKGKHDLKTRTALLLKSELIMTALTYSLKKVTAVPRPDTGQPTSFPSGHTAQAFAAATFLAKEYGDESIWYPIAGYTIAAGIGTMRVLNNRHWASDVLVGAGIGILSTNLAYLWHDHKHGKSSSSTILIPSYDGQTGAVTMIRTIP